MFVTTAGRTNESMIDTAKQVAAELETPYFPRRKQSVASLMDHYGSGCIIVGKERLEIFQAGAQEPFFFHPNSAMFRIKRLLKGEHDPFIDASGLSEGMSLLDCTLGLASDSIVASFVTGEEGNVTGIEGQKYLAYIIRQGLSSWEAGLPAVNAAMRRIKVNYSDSHQYLQNLADESFDCVYFDPMFDEAILESDGIKTLGQFAIREGLDEEMIHQAIRVAKRRVILKDHYKSNRFEKYGFTVKKRQSAKFHFGFIQK